MSEQNRPIYAPIPLRALQDPTLSGADLRTLGAIAAHDRFTKNGTGCFASHARLATMTGLHQKAVARSIGRLRDAGYLIVERNPMNGRLAVYRVIYSDDDATAMRGDGRSGVRPTKPRPVPIGNKSATDQSARIGSRAVTDETLIGNNQNQKASQNQCDVDRNIFPERDNRLGEALARRDEAERAAPPELFADAESVASAAQSGSIDLGTARNRLRRIFGRVRAFGDEQGERRIMAIMDAVERDAPDRTQTGAGLLASPMELAAIREARARGTPPPAWVRAEVREAC
ncbi:MAG: helix-turn-helix domain-containing protein [Parvularculaceae bacterium]|nr:helix-turn-helix domain-containing protein [Parvularculaceae bacterium]